MTHDPPPALLTTSFLPSPVQIHQRLVTQASLEGSLDTACSPHLVTASSVHATAPSHSSPTPTPFTDRMAEHQSTSAASNPSTDSSGHATVTIEASPRPPVTLPKQGIVFTSTRTPPHRPSALPRVRSVDTHVHRSSNPEAVPAASQRRVPRSAPAPRVDPGALRMLQWTWLVVGGVGLWCALGGVLFYQLSKDEEALSKGRAERRKRWGYLEYTWGAQRRGEEQAEEEQQRRPEEESQEREAQEPVAQRAAD